jgi:PBP1b-binding outer membrane lipoprotein LpoB
MKPVVILFALLLAGCAQKFDESVYVGAPKVERAPALKDTIPKSVLTCAAEPIADGVKSNADAAEYIIDIRAAGRDCRRKLKAVRGLIESEVR